MLLIAGTVHPPSCSSLPCAGSQGEVRSRAVAAYVGMALFCFFSFLLMFVGSAAAYATNARGLGGMGPESRVRRFFTSMRTPAKGTDTRLVQRGFLWSQALAWAGCAVTLGGLAAMQSYCDGNADYFAAVRLPWVTYPADGRLDCAVFIADKWWAWALQLLTLSLLALGWYRSWLAPFKVRRRCAPPRADRLPVGGADVGRPPSRLSRYPAECRWRRGRF